MAASAHLDGGLGGVRGVVVLAERQAVACSSSQECAGVDVIASLSGVPTDGSVAIGLVRGCAVGGGGRVDLLQDLTSSLGGSACGTGSVSGGEVAAAAGGGDDNDGAVADGVLAWARRGALAVAAVNVTAASNGAEGDSRPLIACAPLVPVGAAECAPCAAQALHPSPEAEGAADTSALAAVAIFTPIVSAEAGTVRGAVAIYPSPDDSAAVRVSVELEGLPAGDVSYHVHSLGVAPGEGVGATAGHWNPLDSPNLGDACNPQDDAEDCEAGDLSGKHGALAGPAACTAYDDYGIALSGVRSVVGRSIVLHNSEGARVAAATLEAVGPAGGCDCGAPLGDIALAPSAAVAAFSGDAGGSVHGALVFEEIGDSNGVGVLVSGSFAGLPDTAPLSYHVHTSPIADGGDCSSTGGHFDPTGAGIDFDRCTADADAGECEAGALAEKHGTLPADAACVGFAEFGVRVRGGTQRSVVGRSVVIHDSMGNRVACANIEPLGAGAAPAAWVGACGDGAFANGAAGVRHGGKGPVTILGFYSNTGPLPNICTKFGLNTH